MPDWTDDDRETMAEELAEFWRDPQYESPQMDVLASPMMPPWMFFVYQDTDVRLADIAECLDDVNTERDEGLRGPRHSIMSEGYEQILNASPDQIACYAKAREAYLETP